MATTSTVPTRAYETDGEAFTLRGPHRIGPHSAVAAGIVFLDGLGIVAAVGLFGHVTANTFVLMALAIWLLALGGYYRNRLHLSALDDAGGIGGRVIIAISVGAAYRELFSGHDVLTVDRLSVLAGAVGFVLVGRALAYALIRRRRMAGGLQRHTLILGSPGTCRSLQDLMQEHPEYGLVPVDGATATERSRHRFERGGATPEVVVAELTDETNDELKAAILTLDPARQSIFLLPRSLELFPTALRGADHLWSQPLLPLRLAAPRTPSWQAKRLFDIVVATILLIVTWPIMVLCAIGNRLGGPGILFRQERIGRHGLPFVMLKFRTLTPVDDSESATRWSVEGDARVGPFARFLRASSIGELPQLWNVLRGDMSLVGPRPERPHFVAEFSEQVPDYAGRHRVPSGLTGWAQIHGLRGDTSIHERAQFDNSYIDNWSLSQDIKILCRTAGSILSRRGRGS